MGWCHCCGGRDGGWEEGERAWPKELGGLVTVGSGVKGAAPRCGRKDPSTLFTWVPQGPKAICPSVWPFRGVFAEVSWPALPVGPLTLSGGTGITGRMVGPRSCRMSPLCRGGEFVAEEAEDRGEHEREERLRGWREAKGKWGGWGGGGDSEVRLMPGVAVLRFGQAGGEEPGAVGSSEAECLCRSCGDSLALRRDLKEDWLASLGTAGAEETALAWGGGGGTAPVAGALQLLQVGGGDWGWEGWEHTLIWRVETKRTEKTNEKNKMGTRQGMKPRQSGTEKKEPRSKCNRSSNKAKRRWCRHRLGAFQPSAEPEGCAEQDPGSTRWAARSPQGCAEQDPGRAGRAVCSGASEAPPSPLWIWVRITSITLAPGAAAKDTLNTAVATS